MKVRINLFLRVYLYNKIDYTNIRNKLYDILIYNLEISECIFYILESILKHYPNLDNNFLNEIFVKTCEFNKYYNNNYRPIYHLESYILYIIREIHKNEY